MPIVHPADTDKTCFVSVGDVNLVGDKSRHVSVVQIFDTRLNGLSSPAFRDSTKLQKN